MARLRSRGLRLDDNSFSAQSKVLLAVDPLTEQEEIPRLFDYLRSLQVKTIIFYGDFSDISRFLTTHQAYFKKLTSFEFSILFRPDLQHFLRQNVQKIDTFLLPRLFCNTDYFKRHHLLSKEVFHFYGLRPEVFKLPASEKTSVLHIKNSEDVDSIFLLSESGHSDIYEEVKEISDRLNPTNGTLRINRQNRGEARIVVLRRYFFDGQTPFSHFFNYYDATAFAALQKWFKSQLLKLPLTMNGVLYNLEEMFDVAQQFNGVSYSANLEKVLNGIKKTIAFYYANSQNQSIHNIFLSIVFKRYFNSMLRPRFNILSPQVKYLIRPDSHLAQLLDLNRQFVLNLNMSRFEIDTPYYWKTLGSLKRAESQLFAETDGRLPVLAHRLLQGPFSLPQQKYYIDLLAQAGATEFWWHVATDDRPPQKKEGEFVANKLKYANQLGSFLGKGLPVGQILILYPSLDQSQRTFGQILRDLHFAGIPFELLNFDLFNSNQYCKIENGKINFNQKTFRLILLPAIQVIPFMTLKKLLAFFSKGGQIAAVRKIPAQVELRDKQKQFDKIRNNLWIVEPDLQSITFLQNESGGKSWFIPKLELLRAFLQPTVQNEALYVESPEAPVLMRTRETHEAFFVFLTNPDQNAICRPVLHFRKTGFPFYWDFKKQIPKPVYYWSLRDDLLSIPLTLRPMESRLIILQKGLSTDVWHIGYCDAQDCQVFSPKKDTFVVQLRNEQPGAVQLHLEKSQKRLKVPVRLQEKLNPVFLSRDHWILNDGSKKQMIHLDDLPKVALHLQAAPGLQTTFVLPQFRRDRSYYLELGRMPRACLLKINGQIAGRLWHYPFRLDISAFLQDGENVLEICFAESPAKDGRPAADFSFPDPIRIVPYQKLFIQAEEMAEEIA